MRSVPYRLGVTGWVVERVYPGTPTVIPEPSYGAVLALLGGLAIVLRLRYQPYAGRSPQ